MAPAVLAASLSPGEAAASAALAIVSAFTYTLGLALQQKANLPTVGAGTSRMRTLLRVVSSPVWLAGFGLGVSGFFMHGVALAIGSLTAVQVLQVSQLAFMVPLSAWVAHVTLRRQDWLGAALVAVGLVGLLVAVRPGDDTRSGTVWSWTAVVLGSAVVVVMLLLAARRSAVPAAVLGAAAGVVFGVEGATLKVASDDIAGGVSLATVLGVATWATLAAAVLGVVIQNLALAPAAWRRRRPA